MESRWFDVCFGHDCEMYISGGFLLEYFGCFRMLVGRVRAYADYFEILSRI